MDAERHDAMTDPAGDAIDREIRAALAVEPSAHFTARVRSRVAEDAAARAWPWRHGWGFALTGAAAAAIALAVVVWRPAEPPRMLTAAVLPNASTTTAVLKGRPYTAFRVRRPYSPNDVGRRYTQIAVGRPFQGRRVEVETLIDPREAAALRALIAGTRAGRIDLAPVLRASTPAPMDMPAMTAIAIVPLTIDPLTEGARP